MEETEYLNILTQEIEKPIDVVIYTLIDELQYLNNISKNTDNMLLIKECREKRRMIAKVIIYFENKIKTWE